MLYHFTQISGLLILLQIEKDSRLFSEVRNLSLKAIPTTGIAYATLQLIQNQKLYQFN
ncbi:hypothetical protein GXM_01120 [Nostoc sphaeroides CCNUC1]|uniref:Uncharacterized protein n=1 Tax=Nostoc sphaeroides CCNUC1 TaxID=2653204 RepID=A0A5P8VTF0_9NOSO|nr:hypothetical protein GXM_01120 [Nostoc sphaeroides CCNUC1]